MTKKHFIRAAEIVRAIHDGNWVDDTPAWSDELRHDVDRHAITVAEAFISLA